MNISSIKWLIPILLVVGIDTPTAGATPWDNARRAGFAGGDDRLYSYGEGCIAKRDPVTLVFYGGAAYPTAVEKDLRAHTPMHAVLGGTQHFMFQSVCTAEGAKSLGTTRGAPPHGRRWHIRFKQAPKVDPDGSTFTVATPHEDEACPPTYGPEGTRINGFNRGRRYVKSHYAGGDNAPDNSHERHHFAHRGNWGNTGIIGQCGGQHYAGSNGIVWWLSVGNQPADGTPDNPY